MNQPVELVVFDIAGTTVKDNGEIAGAFAAAMSDFGYSIPVAKINPLMGYKKTEAIRLLLNEFEENSDKITGRLIDKIHNRFLRIMVDYYAGTNELQALPNAENVFQDLRSKNIRIGLTTGFSKEISDVIMQRMGWLNNHLVDYVVSSSEVPAGRPHPFMIEELMQRSGTRDPKKVIKVGDTEVDVHEGKNAGCLYSIGITTGAFTRAELEGHGPSFIIDDLADLVPIIENHS